MYPSPFTKTSIKVDGTSKGVSNAHKGKSVKVHGMRLD